jgi:hypothetical protein
MISLGASTARWTDLWLSGNASIAGNVGIGTTSPKTVLQVNGVITPNNNNTYTLGDATYRFSEVYATNGVINTSDARLKENIVSLGYGLDTLLQLNPVSFTWKDKPAGGTYLGLIAQEVLTLIPEIVNIGNDPNRTLGLNYDGLAPILIKGLQEENARVDSIADQVEILNISATSTEALVEIETGEDSPAAAAFVVNQAGEGDVADFRSADVSIMNVSSQGKVAIVGELEVDGRIMVCSSGACSSRLDEKVDDTMGDLGVEGKVVAGAYEGYCDEGYVWIPGSAEYGTLPGFCIMANRASIGDKPQSIDSSTAYWTSLSQGEADIHCQSLGEGYHLTTDSEWMTIAENITRVAANDSDAGKEGLQLSLSASGLALTNGNSIYGLTGMGEWTKGIANRGDLPLVGSFDWAEYGDVSSYKSLGIIRPPYYMTDTDNGIGKIMTGETGGNVRGYIRGLNGVYSLDLSHAPTESLPEVGFRCAK